MKLILLCDEEELFNGDVSKVNLETDNGKVTILPNHQSYMTKIIKKVTYTAINGESHSVDIDIGIAYTNGDSCFVAVNKCKS